MVLHHFGFDQLGLAFYLERHPRGRAQRANIAHLRRMVILQLMPRQRHFMRTEQHMLVLAQVQAVGVAEEVVDKIAGRVFIHVAR